MEDDFKSKSACRKRYTKGMYFVGSLNGIVLGIAFSIFYIPITKYRRGMKIFPIFLKSVGSLSGNICSFSIISGLFSYGTAYY